jgi:PA domain/Secretion system C-terminal sorting domain
MKKLILSLIAITAITISTNAQIIVRGISPTAVVGNKPFTWADNWGQTPNFNIPGTWVQDTLAICEDGTPGMSTTTIPHPLSQEACNPLTNASSVAGKIAVLYRGTCEFGAKALNAQNAGAVAVIIINRDPDPVGMGAGAQGANVTIPVVMVGSAVGVEITNAMASGAVVMFLGNKIGILADDLTINSSFAKIPTSAGISSLLTNNVLDPAVRVFNFGSAAQSGVTIALNVNGPGVAGPSVYSNTVTVANIAAGDSVDVVNGNPNFFPTLNLAALADGEYFMTYSSYATSADLDSTDNEYSSSFTVNTNFHSLSRLDANNDPVHNTYPQNITNPGNYDACMSFVNSAASDVMLTGAKYVPHADTATVDMTGEEITFTVYEWTGPNDLTTLVSPPVYSTSDYLAGNGDNDVVQFHAFPTAVPLIDDMVYLICVSSTAVESIVFGWDNDINYDGNESYDILLSSPINIAGTWFSGWSGTNALGLALELKPNTVGLDESAKLEAVAFPNPTNDVLNLRVNAEGAATVIITDISGKTVATNNITLFNGTGQVNTASLASGAYVMTITAANGASAKLNVIKN